MVNSTFDLSTSTSNKFISAQKFPELHLSGKFGKIPRHGLQDRPPGVLIWPYLLWLCVTLTFDLLI